MQNEKGKRKLAAMTDEEKKEFKSEENKRRSELRRMEAVEKYE